MKHFVTICISFYLDFILLVIRTNQRVTDENDFVHTIRQADYRLHALAVGVYDQVRFCRDYAYYYEKSVHKVASLLRSNEIFKNSNEHR